MREVTEKEFWDVVYPLNATSTETYRNGDYNEHFGIGRGDGHRLLGWIRHTGVRKGPRVSRYFLSTGE